MAPQPPAKRDRTLPIDPWADQAARHEASGRRRRRWFGGAVVAAVVAVAAIVWLVGSDGSESADSHSTGSNSTGSRSTDSRSTGSNSTGSDRTDQEETDTVAFPTIPAAQAGATTSLAPSGRPGDVLVAADIDELWLIDRGDDTYGWGARITSRAPQDRGPVTISAVFLDGSGEEVVRVGERVRSLASGATATVGGVVEAPTGTAQSVAVDVAIGEPVDDPAPRPDDLVVVAVERRSAGESGDQRDSVVGRLRSSLTSDLVDIRLGLVWRDPAGQVIAAVFHDVERVRPGVDARFDVPIGDAVDVDGPPTEVVWTS